MRSSPSLLHRLLNDNRPALARLLARHVLWDEDGQQLVVELTAFSPELGFMTIPAWGKMLTLKETPELPDWPLLHWPEVPALTAWRRRIPDWVADTLRRLPRSHQLRLLWLCARYPQMLEMLEKTPVMAWRIAAWNIPENELKRYFPEPRARLAARLGWPGRRETIRFLNRLRLRSMNETMLDQVDACLNQPAVLEKAVHLPRINSMALTLSAHFPQLIDTPLYHSLARQPCRPEQCRQLHATLSDALALADWLGERADSLARCRFMVEIDEIYAKWLEKALKTTDFEDLFADEKIDLENFRGTPSDWRPVTTPERLRGACEATGHAWFIEHARGARLFQHHSLPLVCALAADGQITARTCANRLPDSGQMAAVSLLAAAAKIEPEAPSA